MVQKCVLLGFVETVNLIDEQDCLLPMKLQLVAGRIDHRPDVADA